MKKVVLKANGKINLFLEINGVLPNRYHSITTVMHEVALWDEVSVSLNDSRLITLTSSSCSMPHDERNIAYKAALKFFEATNIENRGLHIHIEKNIPMEAGLAGGSTDGAAVLKALNQIYGYPLTVKELCKIGASVGADIPFCILGGSVLCEGIGDIMTPIDPLPPCHILIAKGKDSVSTKWAYEQFDKMEGRQILENNMPELLKSGDLVQICRGMYNCFELLVPSVAEIKDTMLSQGALGSMMSGSGAAVFGIFDSKEKMQKAADKLKEKNIWVFCCHNL